MVEKVSNAFVFEAEIGLGAGVEVGVGPVKLEIEATKTFGYQYSNNSNQYTSTTAGASLKLDKNKVGLAIDVRNYDDGKGNPMTMPWQIWNDEGTVREVTVTYKNNKYIGSESYASGGMFIGIDLGTFFGIGGRIKIGFNI